jgi:2-oxoglutarate ferredoxin oxidoreductase subunit gamma
MSAGSKYEIVIAGRGGQGIQLAGYILGKALIYEGYYVVNSEEYSAETRGGDSKAELIVAKDEEPDLLTVQRADLAAFMYTDQMSKYYKLIGKSATLVLDSTFIKEAPKDAGEAFMVPFTDIAEKQVGNIRTANMVMLGYFAAKTKLASLDSLIDAMKSVTNPSWIDINAKALRAGYELK